MRSSVYIMRSSRVSWAHQCGFPMLWLVSSEETCSLSLYCRRGFTKTWLSCHLLLNFQFPDQWEHKFTCFETNKAMVYCYRSHSRIRYLYLWPLSLVLRSFQVYFFIIRFCCFVCQTRELGQDRDTEAGWQWCERVEHSFPAAPLAFP